MTDAHGSRFRPRVLPKPLASTVVLTSLTGLMVGAGGPAPNGELEQANQAVVSTTLPTDSADSRQDAVGG